MSGDEREAPRFFSNLLQTFLVPKKENAIMSALVALFSSFVRKGEV